MLQQLVEACWGLQRQGIALLESRWGEGVVAMIEHALGVALASGGSLDAEVAEHSIRSPAAHKADVVAVHACHKQSGGSAGAEGSRGDQRRGDASLCFNGGSGVAKSGGHVRRRRRIPLLSDRIVVIGDGSFGRSLEATKSVCDAAEGLSGAEERVVGSLVPYQFTANSILLVTESQPRMANAQHCSRVIQRC